MKRNEDPSKYYFTLIPMSGLRGTMDTVGNMGSHHPKSGRCTSTREVKDRKWDPLMAYP